MGMIRASALALALLLTTVPVTLNSQPPHAAAEKVAAQVEAMKAQRGRVPIPEANATLDLGDSYDFYNRDDAKKILTDVWGNPPAAVSGVLGLVMPAGASPYSDAWGAVITFETTGYVSDDDAADVDYDELLSQLREGEDEKNTQLREAGYQGAKLVGWAESPRYDGKDHSVIWARNIQFDGETDNTLNYDVRTLGRNGVLSLNLISKMSKLPEVKSAAQAFASHAAFEKGSRYADFNPDTDEKAEYGIGGLIAAGVGVAAAKKLGLFALLLKFFKPILIGIIALFAVFRNKIMGLFGRKADAFDEDEA